ncbi:hypothetical protein HK103_005278 [Boothiomyces macroporosus]|uniref:Uncharacterized protein n=1 Tax=Boothiomyces macroporosus TaxID=261099 RepID=A0AAD5UC59_9FUNG|nr:hypothetical protein HK103_000315 [Boothiomyces macroporosus]KAJ3256535.1 hypothetical protein HK103_005278 [Boothiomyces macroporosus]
MDLKPLKRSISPKGRIRGLILVLAWISLVLLCFRQDGFSVILDCTRLAALLELKRAVTKIMKKHYARKMEGMHSEKSYLPQSMASQRSSKPRSLIRSLREPSIGVEQGVNLVREPSALSRRDLHRAHSKKDLSRVNSISRNGKIVKEDNPPVINPIEQSPANIQTSNTSEMLTIPEKALDEQDDHSHTPSEAIPLPALPETKITVEDFQPPNVCCDSGQTLQSKSSDQVKAE